MKKLLLTIIIGIFASLIPSSATTLTEQADSAYTQDNYIEAIKLYEQAIIDNGTSSSIYYNLGNAYYRVGKLGKAIVCYERAIALEPNNEDALTNLEFVNRQITDKPGDNGTWIYNTISDLIKGNHSNTWAVYALISFILLLISIALYIFSSKISLKKIGFFIAIILLFTTIITNIFAIKAKEYATTHNMAIIIEPSTILSTSPRAPKDRTEEAMLLHEGTKLEILDSIKGTGNDNSKWFDVKIDNNHRAWINASAVEII